jgi:hypothetical protein
VVVSITDWKKRKPLWEQEDLQASYYLAFNPYNQWVVYSNPNLAKQSTVLKRGLHRKAVLPAELAAHVQPNPTQ